MAVTDTQIVNWLNDFDGGLDTNKPRTGDVIANNLDGEFRNIKSVIRAESTLKQWERWNLTPTYISATSFSLAGDQTGVATLGRRVQCRHAGGNIRYGWITASVYTSLTTVTVQLDSGTLASDISEVYFGALQGPNNRVAMPHNRRCGSATISYPARSVRVTFGTTQGEWLPYYVIVTAAAQASNPTDYRAYLPRTANADATGFDITLDTNGTHPLGNPGAVTFHWMLARN